MRLSDARVLFIDIETSPNLAYVWRMFRENVSLAQLVDVTQMISFAAKWRGRKNVMFYSDFHDGHDNMVQAAFDVLDEADIVVHYNGKTFDVPHMNREFALSPTIQGPPSPFQQVDLLKTVRKQFRFTSNKLDHITQQFGQAGKVRHTGFDLWRGCLEGDPKAWSLMRRYNKGDVTELEELYDKLIPWIVSHPHLALFTDDVEADRCGRCGSTNLTRQGYAYTSVSKFQRFRCSDCGGWSRGKRAVASVDARPVN